MKNLNTFPVVVPEVSGDLVASVVYGRALDVQTARRERRLLAMRPVAIDVLGRDGRDEPLNATLMDVGARGIGLLCSRRLTRGQRFSITMESRGSRMALFYQVRNCVPAPGGMHRAGAECLGVLARDGKNRPEAVILALVGGRCRPVGD